MTILGKIWRSRARRLGLWLLALMMLGVTPALAQTSDELRERIVEAIDLYQMGLGEDDSAFYRYDQIVVVPDGENFAVAIEGLDVVLDPVTETLLRIGTVDFMLHPAGTLAGDALYRVTDFKVPDLFLAYESGVEQARIRHEGASLEALWSFAYMTPLSLDFGLKSMTIEDPQGAVLATLATLTSDIRSHRKQGDVYDMTFNLRLADLKADDDGDVVSINSLVALSRASDYDLKAALDSTRQLKALVDSGEAEEAQAKYLQDFVMSSAAWGGDSEMQIEVLGLAFGDLATGSAIKIEQLDFGVSMDNTEEELATIGVGFGHRGLDATGDAGLSGPLAEAMTPTDSAFQFDLQKLPLRALMALFLEAATEAPGDEGAAGGTGDLAVDMMLDPRTQQITEMMTQAGTSLVIRDTQVKTKVSSMDMGGAFKIDPEAFYGVSGALDATLVGLDEIMRLTQETLESEDPEARQEAANTLGMLGMLQAYAARETDAEGNTVDRYRLEVSPDGMVAVNGQPVIPPPGQQVQ